MDNRAVAIFVAVTASMASLLVFGMATRSKTADKNVEGGPAGKTASRKDKRLDALLEAVRDPSLDAATRAELLRALARDHQSLGSRLVQFVTNPTHWRMVWFGVGWLVMLMAGMPLALHAADAISLSHHALPSLATTAMAGFAMITLPMAWRELSRRERATQHR